MGSKTRFPRSVGSLRLTKKFWNLFRLLGPKSKNVYDLSINYYLNPQYGVSGSISRYTFKDSKYVLERMFIQAVIDRLSPLTLFRAFIRGYITGDVDLRVFIDKIRKEIKIQDSEMRLLEKESAEEKEKVIKQFALDPKDIDNVFDVLDANYDVIRRKQ